MTKAYGSRAHDLAIVKLARFFFLIKQTCLIIPLSYICSVNVTLLPVFDMVGSCFCFFVFFITGSCFCYSIKFIPTVYLVLFSCWWVCVEKENFTISHPYNLLIIASFIINFIFFKVASFIGKIVKNK